MIRLLLLALAAALLLLWVVIRPKRSVALKSGVFLPILTAALLVFAALLYLLVSGEPPQRTYVSPQFSGGEIVPAEVEADP